MLDEDDEQSTVNVEYNWRPIGSEICNVYHHSSTMCPRFKGKEKEADHEGRAHVVKIRITIAAEVKSNRLGRNLCILRSLGNSLSREK